MAGFKLVWVGDTLSVKEAHQEAKGGTMPFHRLRALCPLLWRTIRYSSTRLAMVLTRCARAELDLVGRLGHVAVLVRTCIETPLSREATSETREAVFNSWQALTPRKRQILFACHDPERGRYSLTASREVIGPPNTKSVLPLVSHEVGIGEKFCQKAALFGAGDGTRTRDALLGSQVL